MQFDADTVGSASPAADAEMCMMAAEAMEELGIPRGNYVVKVNNRKVLDGVMESIGLAGDENAGRRLTVLRAIDKLDKFPLPEVRKLLGQGRWDGGEEGKGDFTAGAGLNPPQIDRVMLYIKSMEDLTLGDVTDLSEESRQKLDSPDKGELIHLENGRILYRSNLSAVQSLYTNFGAYNALSKQGVDELQDIINVCIPSGFGYDRIRIDPSVVRGLEYYTGAVFEVELLLETKDEKGRPVRFGSVGGGGRYDGLVSRFRGEPVPATGFSIGVSRLQAALTMLGKLDTTPEFGPVVVTMFDRDRVADYQKMVAELRAANIRAELYLGNPKNMGNQLKYADKRNSPCVIIQGSDEKDDPAGSQVLLKDLILGAELAKLEKDRDEYLQKQGEAQTKVPQASLVGEVRKILDRHAVKWK
jgi:histidyl-tRNA synthetase